MNKKTELITFGKLKKMLDNVPDDTILTVSSNKFGMNVPVETICRHEVNDELKEISFKITI